MILSTDKIDIKNIKEITTYTKNYPPYSEFSPLTLLAWDTEHTSRVGYLFNNLILIVKDEYNNHFIQTFLGSNALEKTLDVLIGNAHPLKLVPTSNFPQPEIAHQIGLKLDINNWDYIYSVPRTIGLVGKHYQDKRSRINRFNKLYSISVKLLNIRDKFTQKQIIDLLDQWAKDKGLDADKVLNEKKAIETSFSLSTILDIIPLGFYIKEKLVGYFIFEKFNDQVVFGHFIKADYSYKYIYDALFFYSFKELYQLGFKYINFEQDLGILGLRQFKRSWRPTKFLQKYSISHP